MLIATGAFFFFSTRGVSQPEGWGFRGYPGLIALPFVAVGVLLASRRSDNPIGWIFRRKYDATETLEKFSNRLREQVDLDMLSGDLVAVVGDVMQPAHASVWLRGTETHP